MCCLCRAEAVPSRTGCSSVSKHRMWWKSGNAVGCLLQFAAHFTICWLFSLFVVPSLLSSLSFFLSTLPLTCPSWSLLFSHSHFLSFYSCSFHCPSSFSSLISFPSLCPSLPPSLHVVVLVFPPSRSEISHWGVQR